MEEPEYTRLHITPFSPALLPTIIPPSILPNARNISYHDIQTFPEKSYGYVELPTMDAEKIKKKLNGTTLKGTKVRIDKARPQKEIELEGEEEPARPKKERKTKRKRDELAGVDIGERQVKRGWTVPTKDVKKDQPVVKSKYTTAPECLFKTNLPPNVASKGKLTEAKPDKKKRKPGKEAVVHEFTKTTKYATFLRGSGGAKTKTVAEFVEGQGWVDEDGNVVEKVEKKSRKREVPIADFPKVSKNVIPEPDKMNVDSEDDPKDKESSRESSSDEEEADSTSLSPDPNLQLQSMLEEDQKKAHLEESKDSSSETSSDESGNEESPRIAITQQPAPTAAEDSSSEDSSDEEPDTNAPIPTPQAETIALPGSDSDDESSSDESMAEMEALKEASSPASDSSSDSETSSASDDDSEAESQPEEPQSAVTNRSPASNPALSIKIPDPLSSTPIDSSVHPLEALYKRTKTAPKVETSSFSFFGADGEHEDVEADSTLQVPLTPYTQKDFEFRGIRSAAPTPDTAHANKRFVWPTEKDDEEDEDDTPSSPIRSKESAKVKDKEKTEPESDFQKWFYENRGDVRRAWTGRRKAVAKEQRQRENRKSQHRAV